MEMLGRIRRMHVRDKVSIREIAKRTGLSRTTLRKWLKPAEPAEQVKEPVYKRASGFSKLGAYTAELIQSLKADAHRAKQDRRTGKALFVQLQSRGYTGSYSRVTDYIRDWQAGSGKKIKAFVPLKFDLGEAFQFDWSEEGMLVGGIYHRMQVSHMKLCASRAFWLVAYPTQSHEMLFDAHTRSFAALGGVCRRGIYDNMKTAVDKVLRGKARQVNARFSVMCAHYLFDADFCNVASGWEKGVVEKNVQDSRRRIWVEAQTRQWHSFDELNAWLGERCRTLWGEIRHPEYKQFSVLEMLEQEQTAMMPMPTAFDGYVEKSAKVSSTCLVSVQRNRYSVPCEFAGQRVSTRQYPTRIVQRKPGALRNGAPFADMPAPLKQLKQGLMRHEGGDKVMAQVLAAVPTAGLEAVLVAVELVVESGALSVEHVLNVLARLNEQNNSAAPASVQTPLKLKEAPLANTGRYDSLRGLTDVKNTDEANTVNIKEVHHAS